MVIWQMPGKAATLAIAVVAALAGFLGYVRGGTAGAATWAAIIFVGLFTAGWLWSTMENYTQNS